jgi:hypothetical protein
MTDCKMSDSRKQNTIQIRPSSRSLRFLEATAHGTEQLEMRSVCFAEAGQMQTTESLLLQ